ncbi:MAG TPA: DedA family protein [Candidatus Paceibacterota bacterium]
MHVILEFIFSLTISVIEFLGYTGIFFLSLLESANIPIPSEVILPFSGFLAAQGVFNFWLVVVLGALGNLAGSLISYGLAHYFGRRPILFLSKLFLVHIDDLERAETWARKFGNLSIFFARFVPVIRTFISFPAGMFRVNLLYFTVLTFIGSFLWSWFLTYLGFILGENWRMLEGYFRKFDFIILALIILGAAWWIRRHVRKNKAHSQT